VRALETILFIASFFSELTAALLVMFEIKGNRELRAKTINRPSPISSALDTVSGILTVFDKARLGLLERADSEVRIKTLRDTVRRQTWAFFMLVLGALAAITANLLSVWAR
jgi:hypothetical protein